MELSMISTMKIITLSASAAVSVRSVMVPVAVTVWKMCLGHCPGEEHFQILARRSRHCLLLKRHELRGMQVT
jgi:hypothetical protein